MSFTVHGLPVSQGIAIGYAHLVSHALLEVNHYIIAPRHLEAELERFNNAVASVDNELLALKTAATTTQPHSEVGAFIDLQRMMLEDPVLVEAAR
ncbi:MAG: phosphoenolpyruvate--protein phosphotransferase, partial [Betaproteobacteria bacterium]|nr:phosphoenolpyruvate--protein phosphotransferase [Betaproteobacteria bacterium]